MRTPKLLILLAGLLVVSTTSSHAQLRKIIAELSPVVETDGVHAGTSVRAAVAVKLPEGFHMQSNAPRNPLLIPTKLQVDAPSGVQVSELIYPPSLDLKQEDVELPLAVFEREFNIGVSLTIGADVPPGDLVIPLHLRYQVCDDSMCYGPTSVDTSWTLKVLATATPLTAQNTEVLAKIAFGSGQAPPAAAPVAPPAAVPDGPDAGLGALDHFVIAGTAGGYLGTDAFLKFIKNAEAGVKEAGMFDGHGPLAIILIVLLGGFALNLTPCVLPMIPINLAIIGAGAQAGSRRRGLMLGATYGAAMALVYGVLGLVVILTAGSFGTINASPWFNLGIAALFVVLGLAMFDVMTIDFSRWSGNFNPGARRGSFVLAFSMGAVSALLAGACVAPVVIQVVLFSSNLYAGGTQTALALPFFLGIGMATPWPFAGAGLASMPKPGAWMIRVKQAFGVLIIGTAIYYGYLAYEIFSNRTTDTAQVASSANDKLKEGWHASLAEGLAVAEREHKPVIIDIWASWCKNCLTMDKTTLQNAGVKTALDRFVKIKFQAEQPDAESIKAVMQRFNAVGLPAYVVLKPKPAGK
ncbi:MAG: thioredoxin family protein [Verrucomicrobiota bacterium]